MSAKHISLLSFVEHGIHLTHLNLQISQLSGLTSEGGSSLIDKLS